MAKVFYDPEKDELVARKASALSPSEEKLLRHIAEGNNTKELLRPFLTTANGKISLQEANNLLSAALDSLVDSGLLYTTGREARYALTDNGIKALHPNQHPLKQAQYPSGYYSNYSETSSEGKKSGDVKIIEPFDDLYNIVNGDERITGKKRKKTSNKDDDDLFF